MPNANLGPGHALGQRLSQIEANQRNAATTPWLLNASTGQGGGVPGITIDTNGVHAFDSNGQNIVGMLTEDGSITAYDSTGNPVARFGPLTNSSPGNYGIEVKYNGSWVQVGAGNVDWGNITNRPATYAPTLPIAGTGITGAVPDASGSSYAYGNNVGGTSYYAVWVGNDAGNHLGKNTSSIRYKTNVREHYTDPANVLKLVPVLYDRISSGITEYGLIAEQVAEHFPELVQWFDGQIDNVRYDLLAVAALSVLKSQDARLAALETQMAKLAPGYTAPAPTPVAAQTTACNNPPTPTPAPLPYTIQPQ